MKTILIILLTSLSTYASDYGYLAHLQGHYYPKDSIHYRFKVCDAEEARYMVTIDHVDSLKNYLENEHDTKLTLVSTPFIKIWSSVFRKDGNYHELAIITTKVEDYFYYIEVVYRELKEL